MKMPGSRRCKYITWAKRLILWIICAAVVLNWVVSFGKQNRKGAESSESKILQCRMLGWVYEITEVQAVFVLLLNTKWNSLALKIGLL